MAIVVSSLETINEIQILNSAGTDLTTVMQLNIAVGTAVEGQQAPMLVSIYTLT